MQRNPILPLIYHIPDAEARVMSDGKLYLYGSLDEEENQYCSERYHVASTTDMEQWTVHENIFSAEQVPWASGGSVEKKSRFENITCAEELPEYIRERLSEEELKNFDAKKFLAGVKSVTNKNAPQKALLYAPDAIEKNGSYYLYFCLSDETEGVAVANKPEGPFENAKKLPATGIDPSVFVDDDGCIYYYWGQFRANVVKLNPDMLGFEKKDVHEGVLTEKEYFFHEGSSIRKRGNVYYYVYTGISGGKPTTLEYATSDSPLGPFTYQGVIIDNCECDPESWNNHGSIEEFQGQWYIFYHRSSQGTSSMRRVCAEPIYFDENGKILPVVMTSQGAGKPFSLDEYIPSYTACGLKGSVCLKPSNNKKYQEESAQNFSDKSSLFFRYLSGEKEASVCTVYSCGECEIRIFLNENLAVEGKISPQSERTIFYLKEIKLAERYEIMIQVNNPCEFELIGIEFH